MIRVTLKEHLDELKAAEGRKAPVNRRGVPTIPELAEVAGVSRATLYNMAGNYTQSVNLEVLSTVMSELQRRGFEVEVNDLLTPYPAELVAA